MNTPSHWLINVTLGRLWQRRFPLRKPLPRWAVGLGAFAPDVALGLLSFGGLFYYGQILGWPLEKTGPHLFKNLFYHDPFWIVCHNFLHSPTMLLMLIGATFLAGRVWPAKAAASRWCRWFFVSCLCHSLVDVVTHFDDGPLLFFPFDFGYRYASPVSYWDTDHYGRQFMVFEVALDAALLLWLMVGRRNKSGASRDVAALLATDRDTDQGTD